MCWSHPNIEKIRPRWIWITDDKCMESLQIVNTFSYFSLFQKYLWAEAYSEPSQTSKMDLLAKIKQLIVFAKSSILNV